MGYVEELRSLVGHRPLILCGSSVVIRNDRGELLMQERKYPPGKWCFPGGLMELGESTESTARREVWEETGLRLGELHLIGVYSGPDALCRAANGDEWYVVNTAYWSEAYTGEAFIHDGESADMRWFLPEEIPAGLVSSHRKILTDYLALSNANRMLQGLTD